MSSLPYAIPRRSHGACIPRSQFVRLQSSLGHCLFGLCQTDAVLAEVVDGVPSSQESIAKDGQGAHGLGEVHAHDGGDTAALDLQDVVVRADGEVIAAQREGDIGELVTDSAVDSVLAVVALLGTNLGVEELGDVAGESDQGSTGVQNDTSVLKLGGIFAERDGVEINLPVGLAAQGDLGDLAGVVVLVNTTEDNLGVVSTVGIAQVEGEYLVVQKLLVDHLVERRDNAVDRDSVVAETQNAVKPAKGESQTRLAGGLGKVLVLNADVTDGNSVLGDETAQATGSVADLELGAILLEGRRRGGVVLGVEIAGDATAGLRWHPEVGAASVEDNLEVLGRGTDLDLGEVCGTDNTSASLPSGHQDEGMGWKEGLRTLSVHEVGDGNGVVLISANRGRLEHGIGMTAWAGAHVLLTESTHLDIDGVGLLWRKSSVTIVAWHLAWRTNQLLRQRDLLELHLVDAGLSGTQQRSCGKESSLHDGRLLMLIG
jgi:hypothetical protein